MLTTRTEWALRAQRAFGGAGPFGTGSVYIPPSYYTSVAPAPAPTPSVATPGVVSPPTVQPPPPPAPVSYVQSQGALATANPFDVAQPVLPAQPLAPSPAILAPSAVTSGGLSPNDVQIQVGAGAAPVAPISSEPDVGAVLLYGLAALLVLHALK